MRGGSTPEAATKGKARKNKSTKGSGIDDTVSVAPRAGFPAPLSIEAASDGRFFHTVANVKWKILNRDELKILVTIVGSREPTEAVRTRMFSWLKRERADILSDLGISTGMSPILAELITCLKKNFKIKR